MRAGVLSAAIMLALCEPSYAANWEYTREAEPGKPMVVWRYYNWTNIHM